MFKYLILCASLILALPSYAANVVDGTWIPTCAPSTVLYVPFLGDIRKEAGKMTINVTGIELNAGVDNRGLTVTGPRLDCHNLTGFTYSAATKFHEGFVRSNPNLTWLDGEYFNIGNGLAMKVIVGDNNLVQLPLTKSPPSTITFPKIKANRNPEKLGVAVQASLKVVGQVTTNPLTVQIGTFEYRMSNIADLLSLTAYAPIVFNINVQQAPVKSCTLANENSEFTLLTIGKSGLDVPGTELHGGEITVGPVLCPEGVDVKVNFFDNAPTATGLTDYLRTVYSDDSAPSQYALKLYPVDGGNHLQFLPLNQLQGGWAPQENQTTVNFTQAPTTAVTTVQKNYTVKYVKTTNAGSDRPGQIKGIMTVQFLYY